MVEGGSTGTNGQDPGIPSEHCEARDAKAEKPRQRMLVSGIVKNRLSSGTLAQTGAFLRDSRETSLQLRPFQTRA